MAAYGFSFSLRFFQPILLIAFVITSILSIQEEGFCTKLTMNIEERANNLFKRFWTWRLQNAPEFATSIGVHDYDMRLDEMGLGSYLRRKDEAADILAELMILMENSEKMPHSVGVKFNMNLLEADLEQFIHGLEFRSYLWPLNRLEGPQIDFPRLISWMKAETKEDFKKIITRLRLFPQQIDETISLLREGIRTGFVMHNISVEPLLDQLLKIVEQPILEESSLFKPFKEKPSKIGNAEWNKFVDDAKTSISGMVYPSYQKLQEFLKDEYLPKTRSEIGSSSLPNGQNYYAACLKFHTTTDFTPQQVHETGVKEVARITQRMSDIKDKVGFEGKLEEFRDYLRTDSKFKFTDAAEIVSHYENIAKNIYEKLPLYFSKLPKAKFNITPVPAEVAPTFPGAYYLAPSQDGSRAGTFYINTYKPETRNKYEAVSLCLHEAQPGHHTQTALTMESGSLVDFRRFMEDRKYYEPPARFAMNTGYIEGWGLYSEYLGEEMGLYSDPYNLFGRLSHEMLRACRLVVDTGMHSLGWSRDKAIRYMKENTASDMHDITSEIDRYITWPGQACGYKIGELKIKALRSKAEQELGDKFDIRSFHDFIASMGGVPLNILENQVDEYIKNAMK